MHTGLLQVYIELANIHVYGYLQVYASYTATCVTPPAVCC